MLTQEDRRARYAFLQSGFRRRSRNLRAIIEALGGWQAASLRTGKSVAKLQQIANPDHPWHQTIGDKLARELEAVLKLQTGTLDRQDFDNPFTPKNPRLPPLASI